MTFIKHVSNKIDHSALQQQHILGCALLALYLNDYIRTLWSKKDHYEYKHGNDVTYIRTF